jgi:tRNA(fMet)-specific endonuclease VapC
MSRLLDTNTCVQVLRGRNALVTQRLQAMSPSQLFLCSVVKAELYHGALRSAQPAANRAKVDAFVQPFVSLPFDDAAAELYATIRQDLELRGMTIGPYDLQIAAIALRHNLILVTHNTGEFSRVTGLQLEDWEVP